MTSTISLTPTIIRTENTASEMKNGANESVKNFALKKSLTLLLKMSECFMPAIVDV
jgi:hypothetical protein